MSTIENNVVVIVRIPVPKFAPKWLVRKKMKATAGTWNDVFPITPNDLFRASGGRVADLKR